MQSYCRLEGKQVKMSEDDHVSGISFTKRLRIAPAELKHSRMVKTIMRFYPKLVLYCRIISICV
ncbi:hypothetical protein Hdeb2414_s0027g00694061 [Helianthus debilis subsp. tardiflorus]